jgi:LEA14-like dessication related protein
MNPISKAIRLLLISLIFLTGCKGVEDISMTGISGFEFRSLENNTVSFSAVIGVSNPSSAAFRVSEVNVKTLVDGYFLGTLTTIDKVRIPARSDSSYRMNFTLSMANLLTGASSLYGLSRKKQVNIELQGYIKARSWLYTKKTEIKENRTVDVPSFNR